MSQKKMFAGMLAGAMASWSCAVTLAQDLSTLPQDMRKMSIEAPTKRIMSSSSSTTIPISRDVFVSPKVKPGLVRWHQDFATACSAARTSGKPVMLFQMMGRLDDEFC
ncbi:MAG TPA: hypothetical protein V6D08_06745 [Candidatus Obscuribacterales bacterium]